MTKGGIHAFITRDGGPADELGERFRSWVAKAPMPDISWSGGEGTTGGRRRRKLQRVERPRTIELGDHVLGFEILQGKAKRVKLNGAVVVSHKLANGKEILNDVRSNKDIIKIKRTR